MEIKDKCPVIEVYPCIQGEGPLAGIPHILIRTTGCKLRCQFQNSFCDTSYASWYPEKAKFTLEEIVKVYQDHPNIKHTLITGGGPTLHPEFLREMCKMAIKDYIHTVTIETEGSDFVEKMDYGDNIFISLSPKLMSSIPRPGKYWNEACTDLRTVDIKDIAQHEKYRTNYEAMRKWRQHLYKGWLKFVINYETFENDVFEIETLLKEHLSIFLGTWKVYLMPAGINNAQLQKCRQKLIDYCITKGYYYTDRLHIIAYGDVRGV